MVLHRSLPKGAEIKTRSSRHCPFDVSDRISQVIDSMTVPITGSPAHGKTVSGIICLRVVDLFCVGDQEFYQHVISSIQTDFQIGSEGANNVLFARQRVCWKAADSNSNIQVDQERSLEELGLMELGESLPDTDYSSAVVACAIQACPRSS